MKYIIWRDIVWDKRHSGQVFTEEYDNKEEAVREADLIWKETTDEEKRHFVDFLVLESVDPDENSVNHYDGNEVKRYK